MIRRYADWHRRLADAMYAGARRRWRWGRHDCCIAAANLVRAMTGVDIADAHRGYGREAEVRALLHAHGGVEGLVAAAARQHGLAECGPAFAGRGDLALVRIADTGFGTTAAGVVDLTGRKVLVATRPGGWQLVDRRLGDGTLNILRGWRIG